MSRVTGRIHEMEHHAADWSTTRPVVSGTQGVVSGGHPLVSMAGMRMLLSGGNAFDAVVAAGFAAAVVEPTASYTLLRRVRGADLRRAGTRVLRAERAGDGAGAGDDRLLPWARARSHPDRAGAGGSSVVHGAGSGRHLPDPARDPRHEDASARCWRRPSATPSTDSRCTSTCGGLLAIPETRSQFDIYPPGGTAVFYPGGRVPEVGELFVQPALGANASPARRGRCEGAGSSDGGYRRRARAFLRRGHRGDHRRLLRAARRACCAPPIWRDTARGSSRRCEPRSPAARSSGQSAWTQGPVLMQALGMLATFDLRALGHNSARYIHVVSEALKLAFADRERYYGDREDAFDGDRRADRPRVLEERAALIRSDRAAAEAPAPGDLRHRGAALRGVGATAGLRADSASEAARPTGPRTSPRSIARAT